MTPEELEFENWWARNHPWDWMSRINGGRPVSTTVRLQVWAICKDAFNRQEHSYNKHPVQSNAVRQEKP